MSKPKTIVPIKQPQDLHAVMNGFVESFESQLREAARRLVYGIFEEEVQALAGDLYGRGRDPKSGIYRAGSDPGTVLAAGQRLAVRKPRLKADGTEVPLNSYKAMKSMALLTPKIMSCMVRGVSTRDYGELLDEVAGGLGLSKSTVSRAFIKGSKQCLEQLQSRKFNDRVFCAVMVDAIHFAGRSVIVAVGIDGTGSKVMLGLREGNTESATVCKDLLQNLIDRGLPQDPSKPFLFVIDGGKGLRRAIKDVFGEEFPVQRCWIHKARNIRDYLPEQAHWDFQRRWAYLRKLENYNDAKAEVAKLRAWLYRSTPSAAASLDEAGDELLTAVRMKATGPFLRRTLTTTNLIEGIFSHVRYRSFRVKNWRSAGDQIQRWVATSLLHAEKRCNRIMGYQGCTELVERLHSMHLQPKAKAA